MPLILAKGPIGFKHDWNIPFYSSQIKRIASDMFFAWQRFGLGTSFSYASDWFLRYLIGLAGFLGLSGASVSKTLVVLLLWGSGLSAFFLGRTFGLKPFSAFLVGVFYLVNPLTFNKIVSGHYDYLFSMVTAPLAFAFFWQSIEKNFSLKKALLSGIFFALTLTQLQFGVFLAIFYFFSYFLIEYSQRKRWWKTLGVTLGFSFLFHLPWLILYLTGVEKVKQTITNISVSGVAGTDTPSTLLTFRGGAVDYYGASLPPYFLALWTIVAMVLLLVVLILPLFKDFNYEYSTLKLKFISFKEKRGKLFLYFLSILVLGLLWQYFGKGFLRTVFFRDLYHLAYLTLFAFLGFLILFLPLAEKKLWLGALVGILIFFYSLSAISGQIKNQLSTYNYPFSFRQIYESLKSDPRDYRVLWLPFISPTENLSTGSAGVDPMIKFSPKPTLSNYVDLSREEKIGAGWLIKSLEAHRTDPFYLAKITGFLNIKKIVQREDVESVYPNYSLPQLTKKITLWSNRAFGKFLASQKGWEKESLGQTNIYTLSQEFFNSHIFAAKSIVNLKGGVEQLANYLSLPDSGKEKAIFLSEEREGDETWQEIFDSLKNDYRQASSFQIREKGFYEIWTKTTSPGTFSGTLDGKDLSLFSSEEWQTPQKIYLTQGSHQLKLDSSSKNLLENPSFEEGLWKEVSDCNHYDERTIEEVGIQALLSSDASSGEKALELRAKDHAACMFKEISGFNSQNNYLLSFDYKNVSGNPPHAAIWQEGVETVDPDIPLTKNQNWQHFQTIFTPLQGATGASIYFYAEARGEETINLYDNVQIKEIPNLTLALRQRGLSQQGMPLIQSKEINPTLYQVEVSGAKNPYLLVFLENYNSGWELTIDGKALPQNKHFLVNGFANAFLIEKTGNYQVTVNYKPQKLFLVGLFISLTVLLSSLFYIFVKRKKE